MATKKPNPRNATLRNVQAANRRLDDLEADNKLMKRQIRELQDAVGTRTKKRPKDTEFEPGEEFISDAPQGSDQ